MSPIQLSKNNFLNTSEERLPTPVHSLSLINKSDQFPFGRYVFQRLLSIGTKSIFGVPGDFNLPLLEHMYHPELLSEGLNWYGNCNELNAAYAADGYSRYTGKIGCVITTYGVGELSAINGVAGAFAEDVKVLHIVGVTPTKFREISQYKTHNVHHLIPSLKNSNFEGPNHKVYCEMVDNKISCSTAFLEDISTACDEVDKVIEDIFRYSRPGYIFIPADFADMNVSTDNFINKPVISLDSVINFDADLEKVEEVSSKILDIIYQSSTPSIIADVLCDRYGIIKEVRELVKLMNTWNFSSFIGKSILDETSETFMGVYNGSETSVSIQKNLSASDLVMHFGVVKNEMNTGHYSYSFNKNAKIIEMHNSYIRFIDQQTGEDNLIAGVNFVHVIRDLLTKLDVSKCNFTYPEPTFISETPQSFCPDENITQKYLQDRIPKSLNPGDVLVVETGSFQFGVPDFRFPKDLKYISQGFYLSIGMALPAALGIGCGMKDYPRCHIVSEDVPEDYNPRLVLCEGDGAAQMTIQELTSFLRYNIPVEILIWNNDGYTVERAIKGPTRSYNDIMSWDWTKLMSVFGDLHNKLTETSTVKQVKEMDAIMLTMKKSRDRSKVKLVEVMLGVMDIPEQLKAMALACQHT